MSRRAIITTAEEFLELAREHYRAGRLAESEALCKKILRESSVYAEAQHLHAQIYLARGEPQSARESMDRAIAYGAECADLQNTLGRALNNMRDLDQAAVAFATAVRLDPEHVQAHNNLGHVRRQQGNYHAALQCFLQAANLQDQYGPAWRNLGATLAMMGRHADAVHPLERAVAIEPKDAGVRFSLGDALSALGRTEEAIAALEAGLALEPDNPNALSNLGAAYQREGHIASARHCFGRVLELCPAHAPALAGLAGILDLEGETVRGLELLAPAFEQAAPEPVLLVAHAQLSRRLGNDLERVTERLETLDMEAVPRHLRSTVHFTLGDLHDQRGDYDSAFHHYRRANELRDARYDPKGYERLVDRIVSDYSETRMSRLPRSREHSELPIFIVGMPRSGTTLVEQILASLPQAWGAGELNAIGHLGRTLLSAGDGRRTEGRLESLTVEALTAAATAHIKALQALAPGAIRVSDKMWQNFENLGFIELLFPAARIIHCTRDPLDVGLSCYFQSFGFGGVPFSFDLQHIGTFYKQYERLMAHWHRVSKLRIFEVSYEGLVAKQERVSKGLVEFLDLEWDPACLKFNETDRVINTASHAQVKKPLYSSSVNRSKHYARHLSPLLEQLRDSAH